MISVSATQLLVVSELCPADSYTNKPAFPCAASRRVSGSILLVVGRRLFN